jgi:RNA polymerase sigma-70 factor (ECF subfamily)
MQAQRRELPLDDGALVERLCPETDPAIRLAKELHRRDLSQAIGEAMAALSPRDRTILRHHVLDDLSSEQVGVLYGVHRVTVRRWLNRIRDELLSGTRKALARRLGLTPGEADSLMRLVQSQVDVSLERFLAPL